MKGLLRQAGINASIDNGAHHEYANGAHHNGMQQQWNESPQPQPPTSYAPAAPESVLPSNVYNTILGKTTQSGSIMDILSILGMHIHDEERMPGDVETASPYDRSYKAFLQTAHGISPKIEKMELPSWEDGLKYTNYFFNYINPYLPVLHRSNFMILVCIPIISLAYVPQLTWFLAGQNI